jgi:hypothetical protein
MIIRPTEGLTMKDSASRVSWRNPWAMLLDLNKRGRK